MQTQQNTAQGQEAKPLVTFIITYFEQPTVMLTKCIESVLALSLRPYEREVIVVDDGSSNSPLADLKRFENDIVYLRKSNGGVSTARNFGLRAAGGSYIQFIDGDDMLLTNNYEHCLDIIRYGKADAVLFDFRPQLLLRADCVVRTTAKAYFYRRHKESAIGNTSSEGIEQRLNDNHRVIQSLNRTADTLPPEERVALQRRVAQLTMDYIYNIIMLTHSRQQLDQRLAELRSEGLFPLPNRNYTTKYTWFRRLTNSRLGLSILLRTLPLTRKER